jgi:hypothetical protein
MKRLLILLFVLISLGSFGQGRIVVKVPSVTIPSQTGNAGKYLTTDGTTASWGTVAGSSTTTDLTDVSDASPINNTVLKYNGDSAKYVPTAVATYNLTSPTNGQLLKYQDGQWVNFTPDYGTGGGTSIDSIQEVTNMNTAPSGNIAISGGRLWFRDNTDYTKWHSSAIDSTITYAVSGGEGDIPFETVASLAETATGSGIWQGQGASSSSYDSRGLSSLYLPAGVNGRIYFKLQASDGSDAILGFTTGNTLLAANAYTSFFVGVWCPASLTDVYKIDGGAVMTTSYAYTVGRYYGILRTGGVLQLQESTDGVNWTNIGSALSATSSAALYVQTMIAGTNKMYYPKGEGLE